MKTFKVYQVDAFTREPFSGNPASVVLDADGLGEREMQKIAREFNNSETAFVFAPTDSTHDTRVRFFTPTMEVPSCGHATISANYVIAKTQKRAPGIIRQYFSLGTLPMEILKDQDGDYSVLMNQGKPVVQEPFVPKQKAEVLRALHLTPEEIEADLPVQWINTGNPKILVPVRNRQILNSLEPDAPALLKLHTLIPNGGVFLFTLDAPDPGIISHSRMFAPNIGILEDPVTGNGHGPLGVYLAHHKILRPDQAGQVRFVGRQGEAIKRPGVVEVRVQMEGEKVNGVQIVGQAVIVFETQINL